VRALVEDEALIVDVRERVPARMGVHVEHRVRHALLAQAIGRAHARHAGSENDDALHDATFALAAIVCHHAIVWRSPSSRSVRGCHPSADDNRVVSATTSGVSVGAAGIAPRRIKSGRPINCPMRVTMSINLIARPDAMLIGPVTVLSRSATNAS